MLQIIREKYGKLKITLRGDLTQKLVSGSMFMVASTIVNNFTKLGLVTFLARVFTKEEFGLWVVITSATAVAAAGDFGIGNTLRNTLSSRASKGDDAGAKVYFISVFYFFIGLCLLVATLLYLFQDAIPMGELLKTDNGSIKAAGRFSLLWTIILIVLTIPFGTGLVCFFAYQESKFYSLTIIFQAIFSFLTIIVLALTQFPITVIAISYFLTILATTIAGNVFFLYRRNWLKSFSIREVRFGAVGEMLGPSAKFFLLQVSNTFLFNSGTLLISSQVSVAEATEFNLIQKLYLFCIAIFQSIFNPIWAGYSTAVNTGNWAWSKKVFTLSLTSTFLIFIGVMLFFTFFGDIFLALLAGEGYHGSTTLFLLMGVWAVFYMLNACASVLPFALGRLNFSVIISMLSAAFILFCAPFFAEKFGVLGVTLSLCGVYIVATIAISMQGLSILDYNLKKSG